MPTDPPPARRRRPSSTTLILAGMIGAAFLLPPGYESPVPTCFGYWLTEIPCPLCGMSRAFIYLAHGQIAEAVQFHPAVVALFPMFVVGLLGSLRRDLTGRDPGRAWRRISNVVGWAALLFIIGFGVARIAGVVLMGFDPW